MAVDENWRIDLERWLEPFLAGLSHPARQRMCPLYIAGLIGPGDRKSVQPMAARGGEVGYDQLHHFIAAGIWDSAPLEAALLAEADRLVGDRKSTRLNSITNAHLVCRLLLEKKKNDDKTEI